MKISSRKIRKVPYEARKELIKCMEGNEFDVEASALLNDFPDTDHSDLILVAAEKKEKNFLLRLLENPKTDIISVVTVLVGYQLVGRSSISILYDLKKHHLRNPALPEAFRIMEDYIVECYERAAHQPYPSPYNYYALTFFFEQNIPHRDEKKLIRALFSTPAGVEWVRRFAIKLPVQDPLRKFIDNMMAIYDII